MVCSTAIAEQGIVTTLEGNATFEWVGEAKFDGEVLDYAVLRDCGEAELWNNFVDSINR